MVGVSIKTRLDRFDSTGTVAAWTSICISSSYVIAISGSTIATSAGD
jgi:hypothetical protein